VYYINKIGFARLMQSFLFACLLFLPLYSFATLSVTDFQQTNDSLAPDQKLIHALLAEKLPQFNLAYSGYATSDCNLDEQPGNCRWDFATLQLEDHVETVQLLVNSDTNFVSFQQHQSFMGGQSISGTHAWSGTGSGEFETEPASSAMWLFGTGLLGVLGLWRLTSHRYWVM
jgi:hypothetical protein